jgi:phosphatidylglycerophosphate synthase
MKQKLSNIRRVFDFCILPLILTAICASHFFSQQIFITIMALSLTLTGTFLFLKQSKDSTTEKKAEKDTSPRNGGKELLTALTIFVALLLSSNVYAFRTEKTKKFEGKFNTSADDWCVIKNKFGQVRIIPSEDATLSYTAEVKVSAGSEKKAQELLDGIVVSAVKEGKYVRMTTETASVTCNNCSMEINYTVKMPVKLNLDLENKFGNADIQHVEGKSVINVKHGRLNVMKLSDKHENIITNEFGNTDADEIGNTSLTLRHSNGKLTKP